MTVKKSHNRNNDNSTCNNNNRNKKNQKKKNYNEAKNKKFNETSDKKNILTVPKISQTCCIVCTVSSCRISLQSFSISSL